MIDKLTTNDETVFHRTTITACGVTVTSVVESAVSLGNALDEELYYWKSRSRVLAQVNISKHIDEY